MILTVNANASVDRRYVMEKLTPGAVNRVREVSMSAGGKGLNVARAVKILGRDVITTGFLGGYHGLFIKAELERENIGNGFVFCEGETRSCINIWNEECSEQTEFLEPGLTVNDNDIEALYNKFSELISVCEIATISGSLPRGADSSLYKSLLKIGKTNGKKIILDTSGKTLFDCLSENPFMIKPNIDEISQLSGTLLSPENSSGISEGALMLRDKGAECVVVSLGAAGSFMSCAEGSFIARVPKINAVNTVGCGDTMTGGFAVALSENKSLPECLKFASAVASASAMTDTTGFFDFGDVEKLLAQTEILRV